MRWTILAVICAAALVLSGCSSAEDGAPTAGPVAQAVTGAEDPGEAGEPLIAEPNGDDDADDDMAVGDTDGDSSTDGGVADGADAADSASDPGSPQDSAFTGVEALLEGDCMIMLGVMMEWGGAVLGPLMSDIPLAQADVDGLFADATDLPDELRPHIAVLKEALNASVGKSRDEVAAITSTPEVTGAVDALTAFNDRACGEA